MNEHDLAPLDDATLEVLRAEKDPRSAPRDVAARVLARAQASLFLPSPAGALGETGASNSPDPVSREAVSKSWPTLASHAGRGALVASGKLAIAFVAGGFVGAAGHAWVTQPATTPAAVAVLAKDEPPLAPVVLPPAIAVEEMAPPVVAESSSSPLSAVASAGAGLSAERTLLDQAQRALSRGEPAASLAAVQMHMRKFPHGRLEEEREALAVKVLVAAGRYDEAKARGARFRTRFAEGFLLHAVDDALRSIP